MTKTNSLSVFTTYLLMFAIIITGCNSRTNHLSTLRLATTTSTENSGLLQHILPEFEKQTGYSPDETLGLNCRFLQGSDTNPDTVQKIRLAIKQEDALEVDILNYKKDGSKFWNRLRIRPWFGDDGKVMFYIGAQNPITDPNIN